MSKHLLARFGPTCEYSATTYPSPKSIASGSIGPTLNSMKAPRPLFFVFFLLACFGPLLYAADLNSKGHHVPLMLYIIAEVVVVSLALFFGLRRQRQRK